LYYVFQVGGGDFGRRDVEGEDLICEVFEGVVSPFGLPVAGKRGNLFGDEEATV